MSSISYDNRTVILDRKVVGEIVSVEGGFAYKPKGKGKHLGETFKTIAEVKRSIEGE